VVEGLAGEQYRAFDGRAGQEHDRQFGVAGGDARAYRVRHAGLGCDDTTGEDDRFRGDAAGQVQLNQGNEFCGMPLDHRARQG
jgi:hypothetical protein